MTLPRWYAHGGPSLRGRRYGGRQPPRDPSRGLRYGLLKRAKELVNEKHLGPSRAKSLVITKLDEALLWYGEVDQDSCMTRIDFSDGGRHGG